MIQKFWAWYERHYKINTAISSALFSLQLVHLFWLTTAVIIPHIFGISLFPETSPLITFLLVVVDYTEIPALITTSLVFIRLNRKERKFKNLLYLFFLNIQFIHIFWITDEIVLDIFSSQSGLNWHPWLAWIAIGIDYLEVPVIFETIRETLRNFFKRNDTK